MLALKKSRSCVSFGKFYLQILSFYGKIIKI